MWRQHKHRAWGLPQALLYVTVITAPRALKRDWYWIIGDVVCRRCPLTGRDQFRIEEIITKQQVRARLRDDTRFPDTWCLWIMNESNLNPS